MKIIPKEKIIYQFSPSIKPVEKIKPGEIVLFESNDCFGRQIRDEEKLCTEIDFAQINPATGPVFVEGAEKGDLLKVKILNIALDQVGICVTVPGEGALGEKATKATTRLIRFQNGFFEFRGLRIPARPMIGVIGVAPLEGDYPTGSPWKHGGNMDTTDITEGSVLYFPVHQKGGLLALGDCHGVMGDGEVCVSACEMNADVTVKIDLIKNRSIEWPIVETREHTMIIVSGDSADSALKEATDQAVTLLEKGLNIPWNEAYILASLVVDLKVSQIVDPKKTVRAAIPKTIISTGALLGL